MTRWNDFNTLDYHQFACTICLLNPSVSLMSLSKHLFIVKCNHSLNIFNIQTPTLLSWDDSHIDNSIYCVCPADNGLLSVSPTNDFSTVQFVWISTILGDSRTKKVAKYHIEKNRYVKFTAIVATSDAGCSSRLEFVTGDSVGILRKWKWDIGNILTRNNLDYCHKAPILSLCISANHGNDENTDSTKRETRLLSTSEDGEMCISTLRLKLEVSCWTLLD